MDYDSIKIGTVVTSLAGRDKGRSFIVVGQCDANHVYVADGMLRKLENPKKKKLRHLKLHNEVADSIRVKISEEKQVFNAEIRKCLLSLGFNHDKISEED